MRTYEIMFIAAPNTVEDDLRKLTTQLEHVITDLGGKVTKIDNLGRRKLAYTIDKFDEGIYSLLNVEGSGREIAEVERRLRVSDLIIRHQTVRTDEELQRAEKLKAHRKTAVNARAQSEAADTDEGDDDNFDA